MVREGLRGVRLQVTSRAMEVERRLRLLRDEQEGVRSRAQSAARLVEEFFENIEVVLRRQRDLLLQELKMHTTEVASTLDGHVRWGTAAGQDWLLEGCGVAVRVSTGRGEGEGRGRGRGREWKGCSCFFG